MSSSRGGSSTSEGRAPTERRSSDHDDNKTYLLTNLHRQPSNCRPFNSEIVERSSTKRPEVNRTPSLSLKKTPTPSRKKSNESLSLRRPPPPSPNKLNSSGNKIRSLSHSFSSPVINDHLPHSRESITNTNTVTSFNVGYFNGKETVTPFDRVHNNLRHHGKATTSKNVDIFSSG